MRLYIIRHAESENFTHNVPLSDDPHLSKNGQDQSELLGKRLKDYEIKRIISNESNRAKETTEIINKKIHAEVEWNKLTQDIKLSQEYIDSYEPNFFNTLLNLRKEKTPVHEQDSGDESFEDLEIRAEKFLQYISIYNQNMLVVSHSAFVRVLILQMVHAKNITPANLLGFHANHTGLTICERQHAAWRILTWNDVSHLDQQPSLTALQPVNL